MTEVLPLNISHLPVKLTLDDYLLLDANGAFADYRKTELIEGEIFFMNAQHRPHARLKMRLYEALKDGLRPASPLSLFVEASIALSIRNAPEPDLVLTSEPDGDGLIPGASVALVIEIADATLTSDLGRKRAMYAAGNVPEYWVADVTGRVIHQMWHVADGDYAKGAIIRFGDPLTAHTIPGLTVATDGL